MAVHCSTIGHGIQMISARVLHNCTKSRLLNKIEEVETIAAKSKDGLTLLNDLEATYVTPIIRYYYNYNLHCLTCLLVFNFRT